jgi:hypothetical protein
LGAGSPKDHLFKDAIKIAFKEKRIVESSGQLQARNEDYLLEQNPILRSSGAIDPKADAIVDQLETHGLMTLGDLESSVQPRARHASGAEAAAFSAALERELRRGHIEWLAPHTYGVEADRLVEYEAAGKRAEKRSVKDAMAALVGSTERLSRALLRRGTEDAVPEGASNTVETKSRSGEP